MSLNELVTRVILKNDTTENWVANETKVLLKGEVGIEFTPEGETKIKVGDGETPWSELSYFGGGTVTGDDLSVIVNNGIVQVKGFSDAETGAQLVKGSDGSVKWIVPDATTVEGLSTAVETLKSEVDDLQTDVAEVKERLSDFLTEDKATATLRQVAFEVAYKPENTLVDYNDKEIRIMCPSDTQWTLQESGEGADAEKYYIGFKAYAPNDNVASFKEDLAEIITDDTMYYFEDNEFAGVDAYGRKYSIVWLPVAAYDEASDTWTYYGENSSKSKYVGWNYSVEWYDSEGNKIASDCIRINLSNEDCHNVIEPYYMASVNVSKLVQTDGEELILNGGSSYN